MADIFSKKKRSEIMSKIRSKDTKIEVEFRKKLSAEIWPKGYRYRKHYKKIPGSPDIVFPKYKIAIFIDGDFWHGFGFDEEESEMPEFWKTKIMRNMERDAQNMKDLKKMGWNALRFWEHDIKKDSVKCVLRIVNLLQSI
jgi:DNA mismatch endonuclease (patch repair protein)